MSVRRVVIPTIGRLYLHRWAGRSGPPLRIDVADKETDSCPTRPWPQDFQAAGAPGRATSGGYVMGMSGRMFLIDQDDELYRLPNFKFDQMLRDPTSHRLPRFAGARLRMASLVVELLNRQPIRVVWITFSFLSFDDKGYFDSRAFDRHQRARAELAWAPVFAEPEGITSVVDATTRFVAQGGRWAPSSALARRIDEAALGELKCTRL
jgi:hypothetical protein